MTRLTAAAALVVASAGSALAHPGHIAPEAGHSHPEYLAVALIGLAVAGVVWAVLARGTR